MNASRETGGGEAADAEIGWIGPIKGVELGEERGGRGKGGAVGDGCGCVGVGVSSGGGLQVGDAICGGAGIDGEPTDGFAGMGSAIEVLLFLHGELEAAGVDGLGACGDPIASREGLHLGENSGSGGEGIGEGKDSKPAELSLFVEVVPAERRVPSESSSLRLP